MLCWLLNLGVGASIPRPAFFTFTGAPPSHEGRNEDVALDLATGAFYKKVAGSWAQQGEIWFHPSGVA